MSLLTEGKLYQSSVTLLYYRKVDGIWYCWEGSLLGSWTPIEFHENVLERLYCEESLIEITSHWSLKS